MQLADFLTPRVDKAGGMMPLPDTYCLFNRARGTELVSPNDLLTAVKLFPSTTTKLSFRHFASGVLVVQSSSHSVEQVLAHTHAFCNQLLSSSFALFSPTQN